MLLTYQTSHKNTAAFSQNKGGFGKKQRCFQRGLCGLRMEEGGTQWGEEHLRQKCASVRPPHVVLPIGEHVEEQPDGHCPAPPRQITMATVGQATQQGVEGDGGIGMEGMKTDAHAVGGEDGRGQQVVEIDEHGGEHDEIGFAALAVGEKQQ